MASETELTVQSFLQRNNLGQYFDEIEAKGYNDMNQIISLASDESELSSLLEDVGLVSKPGHRKRFIAAINILISMLKYGGCTNKHDDENTGTSVSEKSNDFSHCFSGN